jgi:hypothetical protein
MDHVCFSRSSQVPVARTCADQTYFTIDVATMSFRSRNRMRLSAFCERALAAIRVFYERSFTFPAAT